MTTIKQSSTPKTHKTNLIFLNYYVTTTHLYANPDTSIISILSCCETVRWDSSSQLTTTQHRWSNSSESTSRLAHISYIYLHTQELQEHQFQNQNYKKLTLKLQIVLNTTSDGTERLRDKAEGAQQQNDNSTNSKCTNSTKCKYIGQVSISHNVLK